MGGVMQGGAARRASVLFRPEPCLADWAYRPFVCLKHVRREGFARLRGACRLEERCRPAGGAADGERGTQFELVQARCRVLLNAGGWKAMVAHRAGHSLLLAQLTNHSERARGQLNYIVVQLLRRLLRLTHGYLCLLTLLATRQW